MGRDRIFGKFGHFSQVHILVIYYYQFNLPVEKHIFSNFVILASAAFQIEGAYLADGKGLSIWDVFLHEFPNKVC
jgi:hypothetical protein